MLKMMKQHEAAPLNSTNLYRLRKLVSSGEGATLEFKRKATHPEKIIGEMAAFANTQGGILLIGVSDDGAIPGVKFPDEESFAIQSALKKYCRPAIKFAEQIIPLSENRYILQYEIFPSHHKPHYIVHDKLKREVFVRVADKSIKASRELVEIIRRRQRAKDIKFTYGEHEKMLMQHLSTAGSITLKEFSELSKLRRYYASRKLILLVLANVLRVTPGEKGDVYSLVFGGKVKLLQGT